MQEPYSGWHGKSSIPVHSVSKGATGPGRTPTESVNTDWIGRDVPGGRKPLGAMDTRRRTAPRDQNVVLVVDDDPSVRTMIARVLLSENYAVLSASNGDQALELAEAYHIDLVLLDLNMPGKGGWEIFERLASLQPMLSVIILTARPNQVFTALAAGVGALLEKPFDYQKLLETIRTVLAEPEQVRRERVTGRHTHLRYVAAGGNLAPS